MAQFQLNDADVKKDIELQKDIADSLSSFWGSASDGKCHTTEDLILLHKLLHTRGVAIIQQKNSDYANPEKSLDPFRNFAAFGAFGILVRLSDKMARLRTFIEKSQSGDEMAVKDEKWEDTLIDTINYLVLLDGYIRTHGVK